MDEQNNETADVYEILVPVENSGVFDVQGNEVEVYSKESVDEDYLLRQRAAIIADRDKAIGLIDAKLAAVEKLKK